MNKAEMNRDEYLQYCKENAYKQYNFDICGNKLSQPDKAFINAATTMICDLAKHPETIQSSEACALLILTVDDYSSMKRFIDGFN
jgi:hypothetical protein